MDTSELKSDASAALAAGDFARAGTLYASYCAAAPADTQSLLRMGDAWARAGERARAIHAYLAAAQGFAADGFLARAIAASKLVLELEPGHQRMQRILADLYTQRGVGPGVGRRPREVPTPPAPASRPEPALAPAVARPSPQGEDDAQGARRHRVRPRQPCAGAKPGGRARRGSQYPRCPGHAQRFRRARGSCRGPAARGTCLHCA